MIQRAIDWLTTLAAMLVIAWCVIDDWRHDA